MVRIGKATALLIAVLQFSACAVQQKIQKAANQNILEVNNLSGAHIGIHVFDPSTNSNLFSYQSNKYLFQQVIQKLLPVLLHCNI